MEPLDLPPQKTASPLPVSLRWGLIMAALSAAAGLLMFVLGIDAASQSTISKFLGFVSGLGITGFCVWKALQFHRDQELGGYLTMGRAMGVGALMGLIGGIASAIWQYIFVNLIDTEFINRMLEGMERQFAEQGMAEDQVEQAMKMSEMFMGPVFFSITIVIGSVMFGFLAGVLIGLTMKKERPYLR